MRIVTVMTGAAPGGAEFAAVELLDALIERGHSATILSDWSGIGRDTRVDVRPLALGPKLSARSWPGLMLRWPLLARRLRNVLEAEAPYDLLLLHYKKEQLLAARLPDHLRPRLVWAEWGPLPRQMRRWPGRAIYAAAARRTDVVLAISEGTHRSVVNAGIDPRKVAVLPNALRTEASRYSETGRARVRRELSIPADAFTVGCTSRFHAKKRNDVAIDAMIMLGDDAHLILAGSGECEADLRGRAAPLGNRVHFLPTPGEDANDLFSAFDVCLFCPSPSEGSPTAVILGMLAGRPCVSTAAEGVTGLIDDDVGAIVSPENDANALAAVLRGYQHDPKRVQREGAHAARRARERFDAAVVAARAEDLLGGGPAAGRNAAVA